MENRMLDSLEIELQQQGDRQNSSCLYECHMAKVV